MRARAAEAVAYYRILLLYPGTVERVRVRGRASRLTTHPPSGLPNSLIA